MEGILKARKGGTDLPTFREFVAPVGLKTIICLLLSVPYSWRGALLESSDGFNS